MARPKKEYSKEHDIERLKLALDFAREGWSIGPSLSKAGFRQDEARLRLFKNEDLFKELKKIINQRAKSKKHIVGQGRLKNDLD